jgi:hypothetical protein
VGPDAPRSWNETAPATIGQPEQPSGPDAVAAVMMVPAREATPPRSAWSCRSAMWMRAPVLVLVTSAPARRMVPTGSLVRHEKPPGQSEPAEHPATPSSVSSTVRRTAKDLSAAVERM